MFKPERRVLRLSLLVCLLWRGRSRPDCDFGVVGSSARNCPLKASTRKIKFMTESLWIHKRSLVDLMDEGKSMPEIANIADGIDMHKLG